MTANTSHEMPLRIGTPEDFARARAELLEAGFEEENFLRTVGISKMTEVGDVDVSEFDSRNAPERLKLYARMFVFSKLAPRAEVERIIPRAALEAFLSLGLLAPWGEGGGDYYSTVWLYPVAGMLVASDRHNNPDGSEFVEPHDIVFPAIFGGTLNFLRLVPRRADGDVLDLCAGAGIGALVMSLSARTAVASDITERATYFAHFNALLNECANVEAVRGDLYEAVEGRTFDRITAHPPYVPALRTEAVWRDGGETGEALTRRIVEGLPAHLRPGGTFYTTCFGLDTSEGDFEERVRTWLGPQHEEFDIICAASLVRTPREVVSRVAALGEGLDATEARRIEKAFERAGAVRAVNCALVIRRRDARTNAVPLTARLKLGDEATSEDFERAFEWYERRSRRDFAERFTSTRPRLSEHLRVKVTHTVRGGELVPAEFLFETEQPFVSAARLEPGMAVVFARFDGRRTVAELYRASREEGEVPESVSLTEFAALTATMVGHGYLTIVD